jgi:choline dehydrogenase-like flavoprotein
MIIDANDEFDDQLLSVDLCIVGAGAAGIAMALQFLDARHRVLVLEAGGLSPEPDTQALYAGAVADERLHSPPDRYRERRFGGTTTIWGGRCMPFDPIDFETRQYVPNSGWPIAYESLLSYYSRANRLCEAGEFSYDAIQALHGNDRPIIEGFEGRNFTSNTLERFSCPTDFGTRYGHKFRQSGNVTVLLHANVTAIRLQAPGHRVDSLSVQTLSGKKFLIRATQFVLAAGGLETTRLMLASRDIQPQGIGNDRDLVGRYYMCHLAGTIGSLKVSGPAHSVNNGYQLSDEGIYCRRRFALRPETQREQQLGNFIARLHHPRITDPAHHNAILSALYLGKAFISYEYGKRLHGDENLTWFARLQHVRNVLVRPLDLAAFTWHMLRYRFLATRKFPSIIIKSRANLFSLDFHAEQQPCFSSRVNLGTDVDALGMPRLNIDWRYTAGDVDTVQRSLALLREDFGQSGIGNFEYDPSSVEFEMTRYGAYGGHHMGTARMGSDPNSSVVDADCRVHGISNLFVNGSATYPTSGQANPTLTVVALSLRMAEHLKKQLAPLAAKINSADEISTTRSTIAAAPVPEAAPAVSREPEFR